MCRLAQEAEGSRARGIHCLVHLRVLVEGCLRKVIPEVWVGERISARRCRRECRPVLGHAPATQCGWLGCRPGSSGNPHHRVQ